MAGTAGIDDVLVGLIGAGIAASLSPALHEREAAEQGLRYSYHLIDLDNVAGGHERLPAILDAAQLLGFAGCNVTHPCKQQVLAYLDELSPEATALGAANTVLFRDGRRIGDNTDWSGFAEAFRRGLPGMSMDRVAVIGAGGAGSAVAYASLRLGARRLMLQDVDQSRAEALAERLRAVFAGASVEVAETLEQALAGAEGIVHATPVGMQNHPGSPIPEALLHPEVWLAEVVYFPLETELLRAARARGCRTLDGGAMAVLQAARCFELFSGRPADSERMLRHFQSISR